MGEMAGAWRRSSWLPWAAMAVAAALALAWQMLFAVTYPLNHGAGDAPNYLNMILRRESNLTHASLYSWIMVRWLEVLNVRVRATHVYDTAALHTLILFRLALAQHLLHWLLAVAGMLLLRRALGLAVALPVFLLATLPPFVLSNVNTTQPEWLQAHLILLSLALAMLAARAARPAPKAALYAGAVGLMGLAWLVKYNSLPFFGALLLIALADRGGWRARLLGVAVGALIAVGAAQAYLSLFHAPTTGTRAWHHNHAWVLLWRLEVGAGPDALERLPAGPETQRWRALARLVPQEYQWARAFRNMEDRAPPERRAPHEAAYARVMAASPEELERIIREHPPPPHFRLGYTAIPVMQYVGLREADELGGAVFWEWVAHHPWLFARDVAERTLRASMLRAARPWVPTVGDEMGHATAQWHPGAFRSLVPPPGNYHERFWSYDAALWEPGFRLFSAAHHAFVGLFPERLLFALAVVWLFVPTRLGGGDWDGRATLFAFVAAAVAYALASNIVFFFRDKEAVALWPVASVIWAMGAVGAWRVSAALWRAAAAAAAGRRRARRGAPA